MFGFSTFHLPCRFSYSLSYRLPKICEIYEGQNNSFIIDLTTGDQPVDGANFGTGDHLPDVPRALLT